MTNEEKELLLKDLGARLQYGVKVHCEWNLFQGDRISEDGELVSINIHDKSIHFKRNDGRITKIPFNRIDGTVLPYLRSMSSMTEEEEREYNGLLTPLGDFMFEQEELFKLIQLYKNIPFELYDFFNAHHFDFRGLIPMGLALEATEGMYNIK